MSSIQSYASSSIASTASTQSVSGGRRRHGPPISQDTLVQDLQQSGLQATVTPDALLSAIQSSIKTALSDSANQGRDPRDVIQEAVQKTLKDNGVDTDKLTSLLQSQIGGGSTTQGTSGTNAIEGAGQPPRGHHHHHAPSTDSASVGTIEGTSDGASSVDSDGDQDRQVRGRHAPPPPPPPPPSDQSGASSSLFAQFSLTETTLTFSTTGSEGNSSSSSSNSAATSSSGSTPSTVQASANTASQNAYDGRQHSHSHSPFDQLVFDLIRSLPSGTALNVTA